MILGDEHSEYMRKLMITRSMHSDKYKSRTRPSTPTPVENIDQGWLSTDSLSDFKLDDKWWKSGSCKSFLETKQTSFGHKKFFLIEKKPVSVSNPKPSPGGSNYESSPGSNPIQAQGTNSELSNIQK